MKEQPFCNKKMKRKMNVKVTNREVTSSLDPVLNDIKQTYTDAFPAGERRDFSIAKRYVDENPNFHIKAVFLDEQYAGFITYWQFEQFVFAEHFAINPAFRNQGIGAYIMQTLQEMEKYPIILEVERPVDELTQRRISFYERLGFTLDTHDYAQPPYREEEPYIPMYLMAYGLDLKKHYDEVQQTLYRIVYGL